MKFDVVILTESRYITPTKTDWYIDQILLEDKLVADALTNKGLNVTKKDWADPNFDWKSTKTILFRTTWDYFDRFDEFSKWLNEVSHLTQLINPAEQIKWNIDKHYLNDLTKKGINCVESHFIEKGTRITLAALHEKLGWQETVIKPTVSGGARHTYRLNPNNYDEHETIFSELIKNEAFILQPFQKNILTKGEVSHIVFDGIYSHSILKIAKKGDYRVQDDFGGSVHLYTASKKEIEFAEKTTKACSPLPVYARVDVIYDNNEALAINEIELIEPELWFRKNDQAANQLANAIFSRYF